MVGAREGLEQKGEVTDPDLMSCSHCRAESKLGGGGGCGCPNECYSWLWRWDVGESVSVFSVGASRLFDVEGGREKWKEQ